MTRTFPNEPLCPRFGRSGRRAATRSSSSLTASGGNGAPPPSGESPAAASRRPNPKPTERRSTIGSSVCAHARACGSEALETGEDPSFAVVEARLDVDREEVTAGGHPDPEGDRHGVVGFVGNGYCDPAHPELFGPRGGSPMQLDGRLAGRQSLDFDVTPPDAADAQPE